MRSNPSKSILCLLLLALPLVTLAPAVAQESRGTILGTIVDAQKAVIPGVMVVVTNVNTKQSRTAETNTVGYYEFPVLEPGDYTLTAEIVGFRKYSRTGITVNVASRISIDIMMEVGGITEVVQVVEAAPLLQTTSASSGRVIDNAMIVSLPFSDLNPFALTGLAAGMQWTGQPEYRRPFDNAGTSAFNTAGGVGQNEYMIDGAPVTGTNRRVGFVPPADAIQEFKLQTASFDASIGHTSGAVVNVESKSGTNQLHGTLYEQHWQQRWNATMHFPRLAWENNVKTGKISPNTQKQGPGRSNQFGATVGAPVVLPWLFNGRDKLFFFFSYNGIYQSKAETTSSVNRSVPKMNWRQGDFSDLLAIDPVKYQIYDPRTARLVGNRVVRDPFPGNKGIPILNPMYKYYEKLYPTPNDVPGLVSPEGADNYLAAQMPKDERFNSLLNRYDYIISTNHRLDAKWYWNHRLACEYDWTYETMKGLHCNGLTRINKGGSGSWNWTLNSRNFFQLTTSWTRFNEGNIIPVQTGIKPSDTGLPSYLDQKAGDAHTLPRLDFDNLEDVSGGYPTIGGRGTTFEVKGTMFTIIRNHSLQYGYGERRYLFASSGPGYSSGSFSYRRDYMRKDDADTLASGRGLEWAAFMMGVPSTITIDTNDSGYWATPFRYFYLQDNWRLNSNLTLNLGLRLENEGGITDRFDRALDSQILADAKLPITDAVQAAYATVYAANPTLGLLSPSDFKVTGGIPYLDENNKTFTDGFFRLLPRFGAAYRFKEKTVFRLGYGWFMDTFNVNNTRLNQWGYSKSTNTTLTSDLGLTFCCGIGTAASLSGSKNPLADPFPTRSDGTRFDAPFGSYLGLMSRVGQGDYSMAYRKDFIPAYQQRWRFGIQRQLTSDMIIEAAYTGAYARIPVAQRINYLPGQYWATGNARVQSVDDDLNKNVTNPFYIGNLTALQTSDPKLYNYLNTLGFFTSKTIRKNQLLRLYPQFTGTLSGGRPGVDRDKVYGRNIYNDFQFEFTKRFSRGFATNFSWTRTFNCKESDWYANEFDQSPSWRIQNDLTPNRIVWSTQLQLPFGKGRRWLQTGWLEKAGGGWELNWIFNVQDGPPVDWGNRFFNGDLANIGNLFRHDEVWGNDIHQWFDSSVPFEKATAKQPGSYHVRVFPYRLDKMRRDGIDNWDIKIMKRFKMTEGVDARFDVDFLNAFNQTWFGAPNVDPTSMNFGKVTSQRGLSRIIQFNFRITF